MGLNISTQLSQSSELTVALLETEQGSQATVYTRETHEGKTQESCRYHDNGDTLHALRNANQSLLLADAGKDNERQGKTKSCREGVNHTLKQIEVFLNNQNGYTQHGTVGCDKRQEDTQCLIESWRNLLEDNLHHLYQSGYDKDERKSLKILQTESIEHVLLNTPGDNGCQSQDEGNGTTHTDGGINLLRYTQEWADTEELRQNNIVDEYRRDKYQ